MNKKLNQQLIIGCVCYLYLKDSRQLTFCVLLKLCWEDEEHRGYYQSKGRKWGGGK